MTSNIFIDKAGRSWAIALTVSAMARIAKANPKFLPLIPQITHGKDGVDVREFATLMLDAMSVYELAVAALTPELKAAGVTVEQLGDAMGGDEIAACRDAFAAAILDYYSSNPGRRRFISEAISFGQKASAQEARLVEKIFGTIDVEKIADEEFDKAMALRKPQEVPL
jgi:hypothetical protein